MGSSDLKEKDTEKDQTAEEENVRNIDDIPVPLDGGWGWVIVISSLLINLIVDGVCFSYGIFYIAYLQHFKESNSKTALVGSLVPGMYLGMGPISSAMASKYGFRAVTITGSIVASIAFIISTFSTNVNFLILSYGVLGGIGFGLMYLPSIVIVGFYFDKKRAFATGVAVCGSGIGTFIFAPFGRFLLDTYGWKGAHIILAGVILNAAVCGALFRPIDERRQKKRKLVDTQTEETNNLKQSIIIQKILAEKRRQRTISTGSLDGTLITKDNLLIRDPENMPMLSEESFGPNAPFTIITNDTSSKHISSNNQLNEIIHSTKSDPYMSENTPINKNLERVKRDFPDIVRQRTYSCGSSDEPVWVMNKTNRLNTSNDTCSQRSISSKDSKKKTTVSPMFRQDIFYTGSLASIKQYQSTPDVKTYIQSTTELPEVPENPNSLVAKCLPIIHLLKTMFNFSLLKSVTFSLICIASALAMIGFFTPFVYIADNALELGTSLQKATFLLSILGLFNTLGRVATGWVSDRPWCDCVLLCNLALIIAGSSTALVPLLNLYELLATYCAVFGLCIAAFIALRSIVLVELLGLEKLSNSFGIMLLFQGLASMIGSPFAGFIRDITGSYTASFISSGVIIGLAGAIMLPIRRISRWERSRDKHTNDVELMGSQYIKIVTNPPEEKNAEEYQ